jgi:hypothetical protein
MNEALQRLAAETKQGDAPPTEGGRPVHPVRAIREMIAAIQTTVDMLDDIAQVRALVHAQATAALTLCDTIAVVQRPAGPPMQMRPGESTFLPTFDGPVRVGRQQDPPPLHVDDGGDITTRPRMEG